MAGVYWPYGDLTWTRLAGPHVLERHVANGPWLYPLYQTHLASGPIQIYSRIGLTRSDEPCYVGLSGGSHTLISLLRPTRGGEA